MNRLLSDTMGAGLPTAFWEGADSYGREVSKGSYLYRLSTDRGVKTRKMLLVRQPASAESRSAC